MRLAIFFLTLLLALPVAVFADYKTSFRKGVQAMDRKQYAEAATYFREALQEHSQEGGEDIKISGTFFTPYLPHYYLGVALLRLGECGGAVNAWQESERQGVVLRTGEVKNLRTYKDQCLGPVLAQSYQAGQSEIAGAERQQQTFRSLPNGQADRQQWKGIADREAKAAELLNLARRKLEEGQRNHDLQALAEAKGLAARSGKEFQSLKEDGTSLIEQWQQAQAQSRQAAEQAGAERLAPPAPAGTASVRPDASQRAAAFPPAVQPPAVPPASIEIPARKPVPEALLEGARAYFAADYQRTLRALERASFADRRAVAQAAMFRAAARMALYWRGAGREAKLLQEAQRDLREGRRMDPGLRADARVFSPRFRSFVDSLK